MPVRVASLAPLETKRETNGARIPTTPYDRHTAVYVITHKKGSCRTAPSSRRIPAMASTWTIRALRACACAA